MATRKRNEWLEAEESEDDERGYDSEDESKAHMLRSSKRQKLGDDSADEEVDTDHGFEDEQDEPGHQEADEDEDEEYEQDDLSNDRSKHAELARLEKLAATLPSSLKLQSTNPDSLPPKPKKDKSGVIYLSRVPPFMKPAVLRSLLTPYGAVGRIFLTPEPSTQRQQRLKSGGTRRKLFLDGWVEFLSKKDAKFVAENLNAQTMGGKKRGRWHDEVWNIKYLTGVKWTHLVEQIQNENAERAARLRFEIAQGNKENARFLENVEKGKMISGIQAKRKDKGVEEVGEAGAQDEMGERPERRKDRRFEFKQNEVKLKGQKKPEPGQDVQRVLSGIF